MAMLVHLNGPPGAGKSTVAAALVATRPLALRIDVDMLRTWLGQWATDESSKGVAREIAYAMAATHLADGRDVILPQLDIRQEVIARLDSIAAEQRARFLEVILDAPTAELAARIAEPPLGEVAHPRDLFTPSELNDQIEHYREELDRLADAWPGTSRIDVSGLSPTDATALVQASIHW